MIHVIHHHRLLPHLGAMSRSMRRSVLHCSACMSLCMVPGRRAGRLACHGQFLRIGISTRRPRRFLDVLSHSCGPMARLTPTCSGLLAQRLPSCVVSIYAVEKAPLEFQMSGLRNGGITATCRKSGGVTTTRLATIAVRPRRAQPRQDGRAISLALSRQLLRLPVRAPHFMLLARDFGHMVQECLRRSLPADHVRPRHQN